MPVVAFIILGVLLCAIGAVGVIRFIVENRKHSDEDEDPANVLETMSRLATGDITKAFICEYTVSGGVENEYTMLRLEYTSGNKALFRYKKKISDDEMIKEKYTVPSSVADKIMDIYRKNRIADWGMLKENDDISLDVPATSVQFITCDGEFVFSNETELPKKSEGVIKEIYDVLSANIKTESEKGED